MAKETVKFDQIKDFAWLNDAAKEKDAKALKSAYRKQAAKTGFARFFINFLPIIFFGPLFHMAYWFVNAIVVAYKKGQEQSAEIAADPDAKANQHKAAFYWDWSRVFDGINEKVIQLRTVKKYIVDSAENNAEESEEPVQVVESDQDDESDSQDDKASKKSSSSSTSEKDAAKAEEPKRMSGSDAEPKKKEGEKVSKKKPVKADDKAKVKTKEAAKKKDNKVNAKREEERLRQEAEAKREEERLRQEAETIREEERLRQEAETKREEERLRQEAETKREEERLRQEAETKREEERLRQEAETKLEEERLRKETEVKLDEERQKVEEKKPEAKGWFASLFGSSEPTDTPAVIKEKQKMEQTPPVSDADVKQVQAELGVDGEVIEPAPESPKKVVMLEEAGEVAVEKPVETAKPEVKAEVKPDAEQGVIASLYNWWNKPKQPAQPPLPPAQHEVRTPNNSYNTIDADLGGRDPNADVDEQIAIEQKQAHVEINLDELGDELVDHDLMGSVEHIPVDPNANTATIV